MRLTDNQKVQRRINILSPFLKKALWLRMLRWQVTPLKLHHTLNLYQTNKQFLGLIRL